MSTFVETLTRLLQDPALATKNTILDASLVADYVARVAALTPEEVRFFQASDVVSSGVDVPTGALGPDVLKNRIELDTNGFEITFSRFRDGLSATPRRIRRRSPSDVLSATPADRVRYVMADPTDGVLLLDENLEVVRTFPGLVATTVDPLVGAQYHSAQCAVTATVGATEYIFIACSTQHCVKILDYLTGALVATIGVAGTAGIPSDATPSLTDPIALTVDEEGERLWIACRNGEPTGADANDAGFVSEWDISTIATPAFTSTILLGNGLYRLNNLECRQPSDVFFQPAVADPAEAARLWVANGLGDVAALEYDAVNTLWRPALVIEAQGPDWVLGPDTVTVPNNEYAENALDVVTFASGERRLYVTSSRLGQTHAFRASVGDASVPFGRHEETYGKRGLENSRPFGTTLRVHSTPAEPPLTYGVFAQATGVVADELTLPGDATDTPVLVVADADAGRLQRLGLEVYETTNTVTFTSQVSAVPVSVVGWLLPAGSTFPEDFLTVEVRDPGDATADPVIPATSWREVPRVGTSHTVEGPRFTRYQLRLRAALPRTAEVQAYQIPSLGIILNQNW